MKTSELIASIHPSIKPSYSPNLHAYLKSWAKGFPDYFYPDVWRGDRELYIGARAKDDQGMLLGSHLHRVLSQGGRATTYAFCVGTEGKVADFWDRYIAIGRCAIDTEHITHFGNSRDRFTMNGDARTCTWCGAQHKRRIEIKTYTKEIEHFDLIKPLETA